MLQHLIDHLILSLQHEKESTKNKKTDFGFITLCFSINETEWKREERTKTQQH